MLGGGGSWQSLCKTIPASQSLHQHTATILHSEVVEHHLAVCSDSKGTGSGLILPLAAVGVVRVLFLEPQQVFTLEKSAVYISDQSYV